MTRTFTMLAFSFTLLGACDLPDETTVDGCHVRLTGLNLHEISPSPWVTAITSGTGCKTLDWTRIDLFMGPANALNLNTSASLMPQAPHNKKGCKLWQWSENFALPGNSDWYLMGTVDGVAEFDLSYEDVAFSEGVLPAYRWTGQPWTVVLFGGPECPGTDGPVTPEPCSPLQCPPTALTPQPLVF